MHMHAALEGELAQLDALAPGYASEWHAIVTSRASVLLEGPRDATQAAIALLTPHMTEPILSMRGGAPCEMTSGEIGGVILEDVGELSAEEQKRLVGWLDATRPFTQVIATTTSPLFHHVSRGRFTAALYYRLNVILVTVGTPGV
jgi:sigma54-dependent transcription regulator